jgi:hypothetical protein
MAITTLDGLIAAAKQRVDHYKTASRTTVAGGWFTDFDLAGNPGAGTLAVGNTANGVVPTDATAGYPTIGAFGVGNRGYLSRIAAMNSVICTIRLFDCVFACGAYAFNANTALASQPSFDARVSLNGGSADYTGLELWAEMVTAATGNQAVNVSYYNETGAGGGTRTTGAIGIGAAPTVGRCWQLPLQAGDKGVSQIRNVQGSTATVGTFNVRLLRPLADIYVDVASKVVVQNWSDTGLPELFADSAIYKLVMSPSGTALGTQSVFNYDVVNG